MITERDMPLFELFNQLRQAGFPLGIEEYELLLRALQVGFGLSDDEISQSDRIQADLNALKRLCQTLWVKSLEDIPLFDHHFKQCIQSKRNKTASQSVVRDNKNSYLPKEPMATQPPESENPIPNDIQKEARPCTPQGHWQQGVGINPKEV